MVSQSVSQYNTLDPLVFLRLSVLLMNEIDHLYLSVMQSCHVVGQFLDYYVCCIIKGVVHIELQPQYFTHCG